MRLIETSVNVNNGDIDCFGREAKSHHLSASREATMLVRMDWPIHTKLLLQLSSYPALAVIHRHRLRRRL